MTEQENLNIFWKALALELRRKYPKEEFLEDFGALHDDVVILWRHAEREDWWAFGPNLKWTMEQVAQVAFRVGKGFKFQIVEGPMETHDWKKSLMAGEAITDLVHVVNPNCVVCKNSNLVAIELLIVKGIPVRRLAETLQISERMLKLHRDFCMADRIERVQEQLGLVLDLEVMLGGAGKLDKTFQAAQKYADMSAERGEFGATQGFVDRMVETAKLTSELTREKPMEAAPMQGGNHIGHPGQVNVVVMPAGERRKPKTINGMVVEED